MPARKEFSNDAEALASQQICHEKGRGQVHTMGLNDEHAQFVERGDTADTVGAHIVRRLPDALIIRRLEL